MFDFGASRSPVEPGVAFLPAGIRLLWTVPLPWPIIGMFQSTSALNDGVPEEYEEWLCRTAALASPDVAHGRLSRSSVGRPDLADRRRQRGPLRGPIWAFGSMPRMSRRMGIRRSTHATARRSPPGPTRAAIAITRFSKPNVNGRP